MLMACASPPTAPERPTWADVEPIVRGECVSCHGAKVSGDGLASAGLPAKPANFSDPAWQARTSDQEIERAIVGGGAAGGKSPLMPGNPNLAAKPEVVAALRGMIRGFAHDPPP